MMEEGKNNWCGDYVRSSRHLFQNIFSTESHIFAFQEIDKQRGTKKDDTRIFSSVDSLIKAQAYEIAGLSERKKIRCFYSFNLLVVLDAEFIKLHLSSEVIAKTIPHDRYIANYIVNGHETSARIHFVQYNALNVVLDHYDNLHEHNVDFFGKMRYRFFDRVIEDHRRRQALSDLFKSSLSFWVHSALWDSKLHIRYDDIAVYLGWDKDKKIALIEVSDENGIVEANNRDGSVIANLNK
jgi:hypothetical protein